MKTILPPDRASNLIFACGAAAFLMFGSCQNAVSATIIDDEFDDAPLGAFNATPLSGTTPNINLPGGSWTVRGTSTVSERSADFFLPSVVRFGGSGFEAYTFLDFDQATLSLAGYNSGLLTISSYLSPKSSGGPISLGFASGAADTGAGYVFYGLNVYNDGRVQTSYAGSLSSTIAYTGGTFDAATTGYQLSYTVDISSGALTNVSLSGSTADYSTMLGGTAFTATNTAFAAIGSGNNGQYLNLTIASVPEPSPMLLIGTGLTCIVMFSRASQLSRR